MLYFPQLMTGSIVQFPFQVRSTQRTVLTETQDGRILRLRDLDSGQVRWDLTYSSLSDAERDRLIDLFTECSGRLRTFLFLDPADNLLAHSTDLLDSRWRRDPLLTFSNGVEDPMGGSWAWRLINSAPVDQSFSQFISACGRFQFAASIYLRADSPTVCTLEVNGGTESMSRECALKPTWKRLWCPAQLAADSDTIRFGLRLPPSAVVEAYGPQLEAQAAPSEFRASVTGGVYPNARFDQDELAIRTDGPNSHSVRLQIISKGEF